MSSSSSSSTSTPNSDDSSVFGALEMDATSHMQSLPAVEPVPPESPRVAPSPRKGPPTGNASSTDDLSHQMLPMSPMQAITPRISPERCRRLSGQETEQLQKTAYSSSLHNIPASSIVIDGDANDNSTHNASKCNSNPHESVHHLDVQDILIPAQPWWSVPVNTTADVPAEDSTKNAHAATPHLREADDTSAVNPLSPNSTTGDLASPGGSNNGVDEASTRLLAKESVGDIALLDSSGPGFSLSAIAAPKTAEEYFEQVAKLDRVRCGLGQELEGEAKDVYGPTWPFSRRMIATKVLFNRKCSAPNCGHNQPVRAVTGPQIWSLFFIYSMIMIYPVFSTVAYAGRQGWGGLIPLWVLSCITVVFVTLCAFTDPGIVPRRRLKNVTDRGDVLIVRVPAPNAQAVLEKLQALPDLAPSGESKETGKTTTAGFTAAALHQALVDGDLSPSVFNHKRTTVYSMERYFETDTGRVVPYNPVLSEADLAVPTLEFPITFCRTCRIARGPRTHHCKVCNNCVDGMDHHCNWTNCCIGRNNYPYFFMSLLFLHIMTAYNVAYNFAQNIVFINRHKSWTLWRLLRYVYGMPILVYGFFFFLGLFFFPLFVAHIYMTAKGLTTHELLKKEWTESKYFAGVNPWSQKHWWQNMYSRLLKRWPASSDDPLRWMDSRYYYGVTVAAAVEDQKVDWLIALPEVERKKVEARAAAERDEGAKARPAQEKMLIQNAIQKSGFSVNGAS